MKLPFAFGINLVFRIVFPGLVLALVISFQATHLLTSVLDSGAVERPALLLLDLGEGATIGLLTVFFGWLVSLADTPIYMLFEGRRFWPAGLRRRLRRRELARLRHLEAEEARHWQRAEEFARLLEETPSPVRRDELALERAEALERHLECAVQAARFPLDPRGERHAPMPTRLGNLIYEYEHYPSLKYGLDSIFFFYRLWLLVDQDMREEIDAKQAVVDGATYVAFACGLAALICLLAAISEALMAVTPWLAAGSSGGLVGAGVDLALAAILLVATRLVYRLSIYGHLQFGELYKALFDQHWHKLELTPTLTLIEHKTGRPSPPETDRAERARTAWRYLRWHRVRVDGVNINAETLKRT